MDVFATARALTPKSSQRFRFCQSFVMLPTGASKSYVGIIFGLYWGYIAIILILHLFNPDFAPRLCAKILSETPTRTRISGRPSCNDSHLLEAKPRTSQGHGFLNNENAGCEAACPQT